MRSMTSRAPSISPYSWVTLDASSCSCSASPALVHSPIVLTRAGVTTGDCTVVDISAKVHVIIPVTRANLGSLLCEPLRVEMRQLPFGRGGGCDAEGVSERVEDTIVGLVHLGDMLQDEYPEAFGREICGPVKGAMFGTPSPAPYIITLLRTGPAATEDGGGGCGGGSGGGGTKGVPVGHDEGFPVMEGVAAIQGEPVGHVTVRARFRRAAACVLARGAIESQDLINVEYPAPFPHGCKSIQSTGMTCSDLGPSACLHDPGRIMVTRP